MSDIVRFGILGAANFARRQMAPAIHSATGATLTAIATRTAEKANTFKDIQPDLQVFDDYEALISSDLIDAVYIPLPNHLHVEWSLKALKAGKHVLCEKPMAMRAADYDDLIAARDDSGKLAAEAFMIVHHPQWIKAREILADGTLGELLHADAYFSFNNASDVDNIRNQPGMGGGGLRDIGVYAFGSVRYATGQEPVELTSRLVSEQDFDTMAWMQGRFPGFGYQAMVSTRMAKRQAVTFQGTKGVMTLSAPFNAGVFDQAEIVLDLAEGDRRILRYPGVNQYVLQVEAFCRAANGHESYAWPLEQARGTQAMIDTALAGERIATE
ncbi:Gfo/Idh/MocA family oxidoreductase [Palleronia sp. LCG004]|uniref:Gfo/Idh/MocA family protein n=1 Tax=Palleronia sp. LCG004 TaxID=3079304 RepID=UPI0029424347|nr:Gfo/Idh/MocA family oxidoreductase [Palleronia sp. LCG004]WOI57077.1 Gfo/Idh/MocA family oxidoreductase [Palleronia sp. LCG004]